MAVEHLRPLCLLLLPAKLEDFALRERAEDLLRVEGVVAVDPPAISYATLARLPLGLAQAMAGRVAKRLVKTLRRNGDRAQVLVIFHPEQALHARAVAHLVPDCEVWYGWPGREEEAADRPHLRARLELLDGVATELSSLELPGGEGAATNAVLWNRLTALGIPGARRVETWHG
jgi:hypothetical protein